MNITDRSTWLTRLAQMIGWLMLLTVGLVYLWRGEPNADEGWYLYASRLVYEGQQPYRDFAFTQTPLLPYVYGLPQQLWGPSLLLGRATSLVLTMLGLAGMVAAAGRRGGARAAAWTILLAATFSYGTYYLTIVKTYALVLACFGLTLWLLTAPWSEEIALPLAVLCGLASGAARLSAVPFGLAILLFALIAAKRWRTRALVLAAATLAGLTAYGLLRLWGEAAIYNVLTYHVSRWGSDPLLERVQVVLAERLPSVLDPYGLLAMATTGLAIWWLGQTPWRKLWRQHGAWLAYAAGLALFIAAHALGGGWHREYLVAAAMGGMPILGVLANRATLPNAPERRLALGMLCALLIGMPLSHWPDHRNMAGDASAMAHIQQVAAMVANETSPDDRLLTLEALWVPVEADRHVLPGLEMAQFSLIKTDRSEAERRRAVNAEMVVEMVAQSQARVVVLTELDWEALAKRGQQDALRTALETNYELIYAAEEFGQREAPVWVYRLPTSSP